MKIMILFRKEEDGGMEHIKFINEGGETMDPRFVLNALASGTVTVKHEIIEKREEMVLEESWEIVPEE